MTKSYHRLYILTLAIIVIVIFTILAFYGAGYYSTRVDERHFHGQNELLKPSGILGHGFGMAGSFLIVIGVFGYMARKRIRHFSRIGYLRYWLELHIFLCTLGPVLVLYHTSFKFGGIVAISFWSMVAVVISGIIGRFIYLQIPRTIEGQELSLKELNELESALYSELKDRYGIDNETLLFINSEMSGIMKKEGNNIILRIVRRLSFERKLVKRIRLKLKSTNLQKKDLKKVLQLFKGKIVLGRRIDWLTSMQNLLKYWHVAHLPFALIMLVIMIVHVVVAVVFGYRWIF